MYANFNNMKPPLARYSPIRPIRYEIAISTLFGIHPYLRALPRVSPVYLNILELGYVLLKFVALPDVSG